MLKVNEYTWYEVDELQVVEYRTVDGYTFRVFDQAEDRRHFLNLIKYDNLIRNHSFLYYVKNAPMNIGSYCFYNRISVNDLIQRSYDHLEDLILNNLKTEEVAVFPNGLYPLFTGKLIESETIDADTDRKGYTVYLESKRFYIERYNGFTVYIKEVL